tara:strand:- start:25722 stop:26915 length:1194 start_codon:yes stop_codon:yes gene_type:complete
MAYGDPGQSFADVMRARKAGREQQFFGNLLQYGMSAGGQFDMVDGAPVYTGGTPMPDKTALWNSFVSMKGGRISAQDVQNFESQYTQASAMRTQKQMSELNKLKMRGATDSQIEDAIEDSPQLYQNLLDLVSDLEASGDENAFAQAQAVRAYLPDASPSPIEGLIEEPGLLGRIGGPLALAGAVAGGQYLMGTPQDVIDANKEARKLREQTLKDVRAERAKLNKLTVPRSAADIKKDLSIANKNLNAEANKNVLQRNDQKMKDLKARVNELKTEQKRSKTASAKISKIRGNISKLASERAALAPEEARYKTLGRTMRPYGGGLPAQILGYGLLSQAQSLGEYLGGDAGGQVGRGLGNLGILGMLGATALKAHPVGRIASLAFAAPSVMDLYSQAQGK